MEGAQKFLETLFGDQLGNGTVSLPVWCSDKRTRWCSSVDEALEAIGAAVKLDCYFGLALHSITDAIEEASARALARGKRPPSKAHVRGFMSTARVIGGVWVDLDWLTLGHKKENLPPDEAAVRELVGRLPLRPSIIVTTGGGLHVYWLFHEPWELETEAERERAAALVAGWQGRVAAIAAESGWTIDATHDLARVLRLPGTLNYKYDPPAEVKAEYFEARWNPMQLEEWVAPIAETQRGRPEHTPDVDSASLSVDQQAEPPSDKLQLLLDMVPSFVDTWGRKRKDLPSQSEYDLALAAIAQRFSWTDQELVNLMIAHRRNAGLAGKPRADYYARTIRKARGGMDPEAILRRIQDEVDGVVEPSSTKDSLRDVSTLIGLDIARIVRFKGDPPEFRLYLPEGEIHLGPVRKLLNYGLFNEAVSSVRLSQIKPMKAKEWYPVAQKLLQVCETEDLGTHSSPNQLVEEWVETYLETHNPSTARDEAIQCRIPFFHNGAAAFFLPQLHSWVQIEGSTKISQRQLARMLRQAGYSPEKLKAQKPRGSGATTVSVWSRTAKGETSQNSTVEVTP